MCIFCESLFEKLARGGLQCLFALVYEASWTAVEHPIYGVAILLSQQDVAIRGKRHDGHRFGAGGHHKVVVDMHLVDDQPVFAHRDDLIQHWRAVDELWEGKFHLS
jgi:hypothetical protein